MGGRNHLCQSPTRIGTVRVLRPETACRDEQLASAGHAASGDLFQPLVGVGVQAEPEEVDSQLDRGCDLVDVLPARAACREKGFAEGVLRDVDVLRPHLATPRMYPAAEP